MKKYLILAVFGSTSVLASICPWSSMTGEELVGFDSNLSVDKPISVEDITADLACLKPIIETHYVGSIFGSEFNFSQLADNVNWDKVKSSEQFAEKLFSLHRSKPDLHISYRIFNSETHYSLFNPNRKKVEMNTDFESEIIYEFADYIYFHPGSFTNKTDEQERFLDLVEVENKNIVLDLRSNGGGMDWFARELVSRIFTQIEKVPQSKRKQIVSGLYEIGMCYSYLISGYNIAPSYCEKTKESYNNHTYSEILKSWIQTEAEEKYIGNRNTKFTKKIILITDSGCASSCETVVEKLQRSPKVTVIGSNTSGALLYSNGMTLMLPKSGVIVTVPTLYHEYENHADETVGYEPHKKLDYIDFEKDILDVFR